MSDLAIEHNYDEIPYPNLCYAQSHPDRLAVLAKLFGMNPAPVEKCRVLELGCAIGGNLIPMAYVLPNSIFVGIDNSAVQIQEAKVNAAALDLENIRFEACDIMDIDKDFGEFDYIIVHGIFSWVPDEVREKILEICRENLAPQGIAYISYNTYPGWHMMGMAREMMLYHVDGVTDPFERAQKARQLIKFLASSIPSDEENGYGAFLNMYADMLDKQMDHVKPRVDSALLHDELSQYNQPFYFYQFIERAQQHGLKFLTESVFPTVFPGNFPPAVFEGLRQMAKTMLEMEQYMDFLRHRTFRQTLLCHQNVRLNQSLQLSLLRGMYVVSPAELVVPDPNEPEIQKIVTASGVIFSSDHRITNAALRRLIEIAPLGIEFQQLYDETCQRLGVESPDEELQTFATNLMKAFTYSMDLVEFHMFLPPMVNQASDTPVASRLARLQVENNPRVVNMRHERVELDGLAYYLLPFLDGTRDKTTILDRLTQLAVDGAVRFSIPDAPIEQEALRALLTKELDRALRWLGRAALLIG